jgi:hypothetical protein
LNAEERLAAFYEQLRALGLPVLVMGGHAVRFYGVDRSTLDYDFHVALDAADWARLGQTLARAPALAATPLREGPTWRPDEFRRFIVGALPDGREELLECWRRNHLLAPFAELQARRAEGLYGGRTVAFLGLDDLIRSKETEREDDWRDVRLLEEIADERRLRAAGDGPAARAAALASLRSRRGFEQARAQGLLDDAAAVRTATEGPRQAVALAFLAPLRAGASLSPPAGTPSAAGEIIGGPLRRVTPGSARHLALVEAVRRLLQRAAVLTDRADKERVRPG